MTTPNHPQEAGQTPVDEMRKAFEEWCVSEGYRPEKYASGKYVHPSTATKWRAWQASSANQREQDALACESLSNADPHDEFTFCDAVERCASAIRNGGQP